MKKCKTLLLVLVAMLLVGCGGKTEKEKQLAEMIKQEQMLLQEQKEQEKENEPVDYADIEDQAELYSVLNKAVNSYPSVEIEPTMTNLEFRDYLKNVFKGDLVAYKVFLSTSEYSNNRVEVDYKDSIEYDEDWEDSFVIYEIIDDKDAKSNRSNYVGIGLDPVNTVYYIDDIALSADKPNTDYLKVYFEHCIYYKTIKGNLEITIRAPKEEFDTLYNKVFKDDFNEIVDLTDLHDLDFVYDDYRDITEEELGQRLNTDMQDENLKASTKKAMLDKMMEIYAVE